MATEALQKQQQPGGQIAIYKRLYQAAWEQAFNEFMFLMAEQYGMELLIQVGEKEVPSPVVKFWRESLERLTPNQMREGLRNYMGSERGRFKPTPGEIKDCASGVASTDRPQLKINPDCAYCRGTGWKDIKSDSKFHPGQKARAVTRCHCPKIVYAGAEYDPEVKSLPPAPSDDKESAEIVNGLAKDLPAVTKVMKAMPSERREMSDADYNRRQQELERQRAQLGVQK